MLFHCIACSVHCKEKRPSCRCAVFLFSVTKCRKMSSSDFLILLSAETCLGEVRLQRVEEQGKISNAQQVVECYCAHYQISFNIWHCDALFTG